MQAAVADPVASCPVVPLLGYLQAPPSDEAFEMTQDPADTVWLVSVPLHYAFFSSFFFIFTLIFYIFIILMSFSFLFLFGMQVLREPGAPVEAL